MSTPLGVVDKDSAKQKRHPPPKVLSQSRSIRPKRRQRPEWLEQREQGLPQSSEQGFAHGNTLDFSKAAVAL